MKCPKCNMEYGPLNKGLKKTLNKNGYVILACRNPQCRRIFKYLLETRIKTEKVDQSDAVIKTEVVVPEE